MERFGRRISVLLTVEMRRVGMGMRGSVFAIMGILCGRIRSALVERDGRWWERDVFDLGFEWIVGGGEW